MSEGLLFAAVHVTHSGTAADMIICTSQDVVVSWEIPGKGQHLVLGRHDVQSLKLECY